MQREDENYISVGGWMWILFVTALPCIGLIMMIVWAFTGDNQTRKNYFRAIFAWFFILLAIMGIFGLVAGWSDIRKQFGSSSQPAPAVARSSPSK